MQFLGRDERKAFRQIEPHLIAKNAPRSRTRAVAFVRSALQNVPQKIQISLHHAVVSGATTLNKFGATVARWGDVLIAHFW